MGLALDEPQEGDRREEIEGLPFVISERDASMVLYGGAVIVDFVEDGWRRGYHVRVGAGAGSYC